MINLSFSSVRQKIHINDIGGFVLGGIFSSGTIEVVCGPMFSGKTEELIRRVRRAQIARLRVQIFKPEIDNRYHATKIVSHSSQELEAVAVKSSKDIMDMIFDSTRLVAIDEVQFFDKDISIVVKRLAKRGIRVICAGLDQDYLGNSFGSMPELLCIADDVMKVKAVCTVCGMPASKTFRISDDNTDQVLVGETDLYEARCRYHHDIIDEELNFHKNIESEISEREVSL